MHTPRIALIGGTPHQMKNLEKGNSAQLVWSHHKNAEDLTKGAFDILVVFHNLPIFNGLEMLARLKVYFPEVPILLLGEFVPPHDIVEAFRLGASDFLFLPVQPETFQNCLYRLLPEKNNKEKKTWWEKFFPDFVLRWWVPSPSTANYGIISSVEPSAKPPVISPDMPDVQIQLLGSLSVSVHGVSLPRLPGKKAKTLLAYLLHKYPKPVHRERLIEKFWSDSTPDSARNCLNVTLHAIRKSFDEIAPGEEIILFHDECYGLNPGLKVERDVDLFETYWKKGRRLELESGMEAATDTYHQAFAFYRGDFLEDIPFEEWAERERDRYRETWIVILDRLGAHFFDLGRYQICMNLCRRMLEKDPCLEEVHRRLMECYVQLGMRDMAIRQFNKCKINLKDELDVTPGKATAELFQKITQE